MPGIIAQPPIATERKLRTGGLHLSQHREPPRPSSRPTTPVPSFSAFRAQTPSVPLSRNGTPVLRKPLTPNSNTSGVHAAKPVNFNVPTYSRDIQHDARRREPPHGDDTPAMSRHPSDSSRTSPDQAKIRKVTATPRASAPDRSVSHVHPP